MNLILFFFINISFATTQTTFSCFDEFKSYNYWYIDSIYQINVIEFNKCVSTETTSYQYQGCTENTAIKLLYQNKNCSGNSTVIEELSKTTEKYSNTLPKHIAHLHESTEKGCTNIDEAKYILVQGECNSAGNELYTRIVIENNIVTDKYYTDEQCKIETNRIHPDPYKCDVCYDFDSEGYYLYSYKYICIDKKNSNHSNNQIKSSHKENNCDTKDCTVDSFH